MLFKSTSLSIIFIIALLLVKEGACDSYSILSQIPDLELEYYDIEGHSKAELRANMQKFGPKDQFGMARDAYTSWHVSWSWPRKNGKIDFNSTQLSKTLKIIMPRWGADPVKKEDSLLRKEWELYIKKLAEHEFRHASFFLHNVTKIKKKIMKAVAANPKLSFDDANYEAYKVLAKIRKLDKDYDLKTDHGRLEGVTLK